MERGKLGSTSTVNGRKWRRTVGRRRKGCTRPPPGTRLQKEIRVFQSIPRLPVRSGPGGEDERNGATQTIGPEFVGERTARWRTAAGEIAGREGAK